MKTPAQTLSEYLLREADRFSLYPTRRGRKCTDAIAQKMLDEFYQDFLDWRKTFAPTKNDAEFSGRVTSAAPLDQMLSRVMLRSVPDIVERTRALQDISLAKISDPKAFAYLREAANCYIFCFSFASIALCRAAVEHLVWQVCAKTLGKEAVLKEKFEHLIDRCPALGILSKTERDLAHKVRIAGNSLLHSKGQSVPTSADARRVFEMARIVIQALHMH